MGQFLFLIPSLRLFSHLMLCSSLKLSLLQTFSTTKFTSNINKWILPLWKVYQLWKKWWHHITSWKIKLDKQLWSLTSESDKFITFCSCQRNLLLHHKISISNYKNIWYSGKIFPIKDGLYLHSLIYMNGLSCFLSPSSLKI